jgi:hypothetical protein
MPGVFYSRSALRGQPLPCMRGRQAGIHRAATRYESARSDFLVSGRSDWGQSGRPTPQPLAHASVLIRTLRWAGAPVPITQRTRWTHGRKHQSELLIRSGSRRSDQLPPITDQCRRFVCSAGQREMRREQRNAQRMRSMPMRRFVVCAGQDCGGCNSGFCSFV